MLTTRSRKCTETRKQENTVRKCYVIIIQGKQGTENTKSKCVQKNKTNSVQNTGNKKLKVNIYNRQQRVQKVWNIESGEETKYRKKKLTIFS